MEGALREKMAGEIALSSEPGKAIRKWREEFGISQHQLADAIGMSHSVVSDYESGRRKSPGVQMVRKMIDAFIEIDVAAGSPTIRKYQPDDRPDCIIDMGEFPEGIELSKFMKTIIGKNIG